MEDDTIIRDMGADTLKEIAQEALNILPKSEVDFNQKVEDAQGLKEYMDDLGGRIQAIFETRSIPIEHPGMKSFRTIMQQMAHNVNWAIMKKNSHDTYFWINVFRDDIMRLLTK